MKVLVSREEADIVVCKVRCGFQFEGNMKRDEGEDAWRCAVSIYKENTERKRVIKCCKV